MEIKSFRIKNYRSIKDSGVCYMSGDGVTILAGKNESGKTAILEAMEDFNTEKDIREEASNSRSVMYSTLPVVLTEFLVPHYAHRI